MGNSNQPDSHFTDGDQRIGQPSFCPNCGIQFPPTITYNVFQLHIELCMSNTNTAMTSPFSPMIPPMTNQTSVSSNFQYQKYQQQKQIPINKEKTEFKWQKVQVKPVNYLKLKTLNFSQVKALDFHSKQFLFRSQLQKYRIPWQNGSDTLKVQKGNILMTSIQSVFKVNMHKQIKIHFEGDKVNDAGGLLRQWIHIALKQLFNSQIGIFELANTVDSRYKIKWDKQLDIEFATSLMELFGIIIGKAIFQKIPLNCYLDRTLMRHILGGVVTLQDISGYDKDLYQSWKYLMQNTIEPFGQYFSVLKQTEQRVSQIQLIPNGQNIEVQQSNKALFVNRIINFMCTESIQMYIHALKKGVHKVVPEKLLVIFEPYELDMIMYGMPFIQIQDWKHNTDYLGIFSKDNQIIKWFWQYLSILDQIQLSRFLQYCTGSSRVPIQGFSKLQTNRGNFSRFVILSVAYNQKNPYPKAHTCFNRLELPIYPTDDLLRKYLEPLVNNDLQGVYGLD